MVLALFWPGPVSFHPVGNTSAVDLTDTLTPEEPAHVLLLGCGDPRNILFTVHNQRHDNSRELDLTCCDVEPAVLARNALLLSMIADNRSTAGTGDKIWNVFFHFFLDKDSTAFLEAQCKKLLHESTSLDTWSQSEYSSFLQFCNEHTRLELRRHWQLYVDAGTAPSNKRREVRETILFEMRRVITKHGAARPSCRSAGPYLLESVTAASEVFSHFWTTGTVSMDGEVSSVATDVNPTFVYSLAGTVFSVHHETTPIAPFHLAPAFLRPEPTSTTASDLVACAKSQFRDWIASFQAFLGRQPGRITIRLFCGEALRFCRALAEYRTTGSVTGDQTVAQWNTTPLVFDGPDYAPGNTSAPLNFNVVETSNLADHVGLLNVLLATIPLLSRAHSAALFTETLLYVGNPVQSLDRQLCADLPTIGVLLGLLPTSYPSNFSSRPSAAKITAGKVYHERLEWRRPTTSDALAPTLNGPSLHQVAFEPLDLAKLLLKLYFRMFASDNENSLSMLTGSKSNAELPVVPYVRETFVAVVAAIKRTVVADWEATLSTFLKLLQDTKSNFMFIGVCHHQDLYTRLHLAGIHTTPAMAEDVVKQGRFRGWRQVPPTVSVTLVVPREKIQVFLDMDQARLSSPMMKVSLQGQSEHDIYCSFKAGFGMVRKGGSDSDPRITFDTDPAGWAGTSPLVVSFSLPSRTLHLEGPENMAVALSFCPSHQIAHLLPKLGILLHIFKAPLMDTSAVFVVPEEPRGMCYRFWNMPTPAGDLKHGKISASVDTNGERISVLTARANILGGLTRTILWSGAPVTSRQLSPCTVEISIGPQKRRVVYPSPVVGALSKLRIARKSCYVEVVVPLAGKYGICINPFPVSVTERVEAPWNIHHLNLDVLPGANVPKLEQLRRFSTQFVCAVAGQEQPPRDTKDHTDTLLNVTTTIRAIVSEFLGSGRALVFALHTNNDVDTLIFVTAFRLDLASHGFVMDAQVVTPSKHVDKVMDVLTAIRPELRYIKFYGEEEAAAWKQLLPAFAERCRTWKHGRNCEYLAGRKIPLALKSNEDPLCSCGKGKDVTPEFRKEEAWKIAIPYVTRIAIGPLHGVPYAEDVRPIVAGLEVPKPPKPEKRCQKCGGPGKPKLLVCSVCKGVSYCSADCQKADWKAHKRACRK